MTPWRSGYATVCKTGDASSTLAGVSNARIEPTGNGEGRCAPAGQPAWQVRLLLLAAFSSTQGGDDINRGIWQRPLGLSLAVSKAQLLG